MCSEPLSSAALYTYALNGYLIEYYHHVFCGQNTSMARSLHGCTKTTSCEHNFSTLLQYTVLPYVVIVPEIKFYVGTRTCVSIPSTKSNNREGTNKILS